MLFLLPTFAAAGTLPTESVLLPVLDECGIDPALPRMQPLPDQQEVVPQLVARSLYAAPFPFDAGLDQLQASCVLGFGQPLVMARGQNAS